MLIGATPATATGSTPVQTVSPSIVKQASLGFGVNNLIGYKPQVDSVGEIGHLFWVGLGTEVALVALIGVMARNPNTHGIAVALMTAIVVAWALGRLGA